MSLSEVVVPSSGSERPGLILTVTEPLTLESNTVLPSYRIGYQTYGAL